MQLCALQNSLNIGRKNDVADSLARLIQAILMSRLENHVSFYGGTFKIRVPFKKPWFGYFIHVYETS